MPYKDAGVRRKYHREWVQSNREKMREYGRRHRAKDPEKHHEQGRERSRRYYHSGKGKAKADEYRKANVDRRNALRRERRFTLKIETIEHYGSVCACCGEDHLEFLQIDHISGSGKQHRDSLGLHGGTSTYGWLKKNGWPEGYRVLCANCNQSIGAWGYCPHEEALKVSIEG